MGASPSFRLRIHPLSVPALILLFLFNEFSVLCVMLASLAVHEAGHVLVARLQHRKIYSLTLTAGGAELSAQGVGFSYRADTALHLGGVSANFGLSILLFFLIRAHLSQLLFFAFYFNFFLVFFHLLPLSTLDGGRALFCVLCSRVTLEKADRIARATEVTTATLLLFVSLLLFVVSGFHLSLCALLVLCISVILPAKKVPAV